VSPARKKYSIVSSGLMISAASPVSSSTSRKAACSDVSPSETAPFGSPQRVFPRVAIIATWATPSLMLMTAPPDECSLRVRFLGSGIPQPF